MSKSIIMTPKENIITSDLAKIANKSRFNTEEQRDFILNFISNENLATALDYRSVDDITKRFDAIPFLSDIIQNPVMLMMALHVLPYMEELYKTQHKAYYIEVVKADLLHMFTCLIFDDMSDVIYANHDKILSIGRYSNQDSMIEYCRTMAKVMQELKTNVVQEDTISKKTYKEYQMLFESQYNPLIFKNESLLTRVAIGKENCFFVKKSGEPGHQLYSFIHDEFLDYFATLLPPVIRGRRQMIAQFMNNYHPIKQGLKPTHSVLT